MPEEILTLKEAAEDSGLSPATLRVQIHNGRLVAVKRGRDWLVSPAALQAYLESRPDDKRRKTETSK
jgi:excisionase family DNA binding protein